MNVQEIVWLPAYKPAEVPIKQGVQHVRISVGAPVKELVMLLANATTVQISAKAVVGEAALVRARPHQKVKTLQILNGNYVKLTCVSGKSSGRLL